MIEDVGDPINDLIDQAIDSLVNDAPEKSAEALTELAEMWAKAGLGLPSFLDMRKHIIKTAIQQTSAYFIQEKLSVQERIMREKRNAGKKIIVH